ncbi:hypothetical protein CYMTET_51637 [Cymbomonas tetramitiformis]|uniref:Uncharacterized protein n=1 Tax=Cymbomonas tetramitiformis TaxID=36881 RepID=A0AAE0ES50_9CHLO|nr:hypothetical protein CYMTET_51637 [Cymbomonas tetramitiformis]
MFSAGGVLAKPRVATLTTRTFVPRPRNSPLSLKRVQVASSSRRSLVTCSLRSPPGCFVSAIDESYKVIARAEIPALVGREDFLDQIFKWAINEFEINGREKYGMKMNVDIMENEAGDPTGFTIKLNNGDEVTAECCLDDEVIKVERAPGGFGVEVGPDGPSSEWAKVEEIVGKNFLIRRKVGPLADSLRPTLAATLSSVSRAVNKYYAFGSVYSDDST